MNLFMATEKGLVKKTELKEFKNVRRHGLIAISLMEGDHLAKVRLTKGDQRIILATKLGMAICFNENDVRPMGRNTRASAAFPWPKGQRHRRDVLERTARS